MGYIKKEQLEAVLLFTSNPRRDYARLGLSAAKVGQNRIVATDSYGLIYIPIEADEETVIPESALKNAVETTLKGYSIEVSSRKIGAFEFSPVENYPSKLPEPPEDNDFPSTRLKVAYLERIVKAAKKLSKKGEVRLTLTGPNKMVVAEVFGECSEEVLATMLQMPVSERKKTEESKTDAAD